MEEENVNDFTQSPIPTTGAPSFSQNILPGLFGGFETVGQGMAQKYEREAAEDKKKEEKLKKQKAAWVEQLYNVPLGYENDMIQIKGQADLYNKWIADKMNAGEDLDNLSTDDILKKKQMEFELARSKAVTDDNKTYIENLKQIINKDQSENTFPKYNAEKAAKFIADFEGAQKLEERLKLRSEGNPLELNLDIDDFIDETIPPNETETSTRIFRDPVYHKQVVLEKIHNTTGGKDYYETLKKPNETEDQFADRVVKEGQLRYPSKPKAVPRTQTTTVKSDDSGDVYGTNKWGNLTVASGPNKSSVFNQSVPKNTITVKRNGTNADLPPVFITHMGQDIQFQPISYHMGPGGKIIVYGNGIGDDDTIVKGVYVDYDEANNATTFTSQLEGMDVRQQFNAINGGGVSGSTGTVTGLPTGGF
jgi:hypothetical protein